MLLILVALGTWQLQRLQWKEELIGRLQTRSTAAAMDLPAGPLSRDETEYARVLVSGTFDHKNEFHLLNRSLNGEAGLHVLTPLIRSDGEGAVLISRGWIPFQLRDQALRAEGQTEGPVTVEGIVRFAGEPPPFIPDNEPQNNAWYYVDPPAMAAAAGLGALPGHYVMSSDKSVPGGWPLGHQWRLDLPNDHLQYAITWYALAVALAVIYVVYHRGRRQA